MSRFRLAACLLAFSASTASADAAVLRVGRGDDPACQFTSLQAAVEHARTHAGPHEIRLSEGTYHDVAVAMFNVQADLRGGFLHCASDLQSGYATLLGNGTQSVLSVQHDADITQQFERLLIRGGGNDSVNGGGMYLGGPFLLRLRQVYVEGNQAVIGGGIFVAHSTQVELLEGTQLRFNTARQGGGLALQNRSTVYLRGADVAISSNRAKFSGGGVHIAAGTGLFVDDLPGTGAAEQGVRIDGNTAGEYGGGVFLIGSPSGALLDAHDLAIDNNSARFGGGIAVGAGAEVRLRRDMPAGEDTPCAPHRPCMRLMGNRAEDGAAFYLDGGTASIAQTLIAGNRGDRSILMASGNSLKMEGVAFLDNRLTLDASGVLHLRKPGSLPNWSPRLTHLSVVGNLQEGGSTARPLFVESGAIVTLQASLFDSDVALELPPGACNAVRVPPPAFFDAAGGDLRPHVASGLVDRCAAYWLEYRDPRLQARCVDHSSAADDGASFCDIGAYELAPPEATAVALSFDPQAPLTGETVTMQVRVEGASTRPAAAMVTVQTDSGETCSSATGAPQDERALTFSCALAFAAPGEHTVTATYAGTDEHAGGTAQAEMRVTDRFQSTVDVNDYSPQLALVGESYRLALQVRGGPDIPTGTVSAEAGGAGHCTATLVGGKADCELTPALAAGSYRLVVSYGGDATHLPATLDAFDLRVQGESDLSVSIDNHAIRVGATAVYDVVMSNAGPDPAFASTIAVQTDAPLLDDGDWTCVGDLGIPCLPPLLTGKSIPRQPADAALLAGTAVHYRLTLRFAPGDMPVTTQAAAIPAIEGSDPRPGNNAAIDGPDTRTMFRDGFED